MPELSHCLNWKRRAPKWRVPTPFGARNPSGISPIHWQLQLLTANNTSGPITSHPDRSEHRRFARSLRNLGTEEVQRRRPGQNEGVNREAHPRNDRRDDQRHRCNNRDDHADAEAEVPRRQTTDDESWNHALILAPIAQGASKAPTSALVPAGCGRGLPSWSTVTFTPGSAAPIAGLPGAR